MVDIENHYSEDNLKGVKYRERASALNQLPYLFWYTRVKNKNKIDKDEFVNIWKHVVQDKTFTAARMYELFDMSKTQMNNDYLNARQILLYVKKLLKPYEICIRSYRGEAYNIIQLYEFDAWIETKNKIYITSAI